MEASTTDDAFSYVGLGRKGCLACDVDLAPTKSTNHTPFHEVGAPFWLQPTTLLFVNDDVPGVGSPKDTHPLWFPRWSIELPPRVLRTRLERKLLSLPKVSPHGLTENTKKIAFSVVFDPFNETIVTSAL